MVFTYENYMALTDIYVHVKPAASRLQLVLKTRAQPVTCTKTLSSIAPL